MLLKLLIVWSLISNSQAIPNNLLLVLKEVEIEWNEQNQSFIDPVGERINIHFEEVDLNGDGQFETLVKATRSYYLWGITGGTCIVVDQNGEILLELVAVECEVDRRFSNNYRDLLITGRKETSRWKWNGSKYGFDE
jgi:hypothetical protein